MYESALKGWSIAALSLSIMFLSTLMLASFTTSSQRQQPRATASSQEERITTTTLSLSPAESSLKVKAQETVSVNINTGRDKVAALKLHLSFDPKVLKVDSIAPSAFFDKANVLHKEIDNKAGSAVFVFGSIEPKGGSGEAAVIKLTSIKEGESNLSLTTETEAAATGKTYNVVKNLSSSILTVTK